MWYKSIAGRFVGLVTNHACDRQTDGQTDRQNYDSKTALASLRHAVKTKKSLAKYLRCDSKIRYKTTKVAIFITD